eukprot:scaffold36543_cov121-Isochrysis_galbana.AAC.6
MPLLVWQGDESAGGQRQGRVQPWAQRSSTARRPSRDRTCRPSRARQREDRSTCPEHRRTQGLQC